MAQAATVTVTRPRSGEYLVTISETGGTTTAETDLVDGTSGLRPPSCGRIRRVKHTRSSGAGANRTSEIREVTTGTGVRVAYLSTATAVGTRIDEAVDGVYEGTLVWFTGWDAGTDNAGLTRIYISDTWGA